MSKKQFSPQCQQVVDYVKRWGSINSIEAIQHLGITRLAARVADLKHSMFPLVGVNDDNSARGFVKYVPDVHRMTRNAHIEFEEVFTCTPYATSAEELANLLIAHAARFAEITRFEKDNR